MFSNLSITLSFCCIVFWAICWSTVYPVQKWEEMFLSVRAGVKETALPPQIEHSATIEMQMDALFIYMERLS